ncbi:MAG TPA: VOC family protein [Mycobacteriales bacterium]|nr:VOC family protein [Mycobacteriales bacterium]
MIVGLDHVQLATPPGRENALRRFYGDLLGMTEIPKPPVLAARGGVWFRSGAAQIHIGVEADFRPSRKAHPGILVDDLDAMADRLTAAGQAVVHDANLPGYRRCYVNDPNGNRLELLQPQG